MDSNLDNKQKLKPEVLRTLHDRIYKMECENYKTKRFRDNEMADKIRKLIEFEVDRSDN